MRSKKDTAEYFPHQAEHGKTLFIILEKWGNDGYTAFYRLLEMLCKSDGHYLSLKDGEDLIYASAYCRVTEEVLIALVDLLVALNKVDPELWKDRRVVWYQSFVDGLAPLYRNRRRPLPGRPDSPGVLHVETPEITCSYAVKQSKAKYSRKRVRPEHVDLGFLTEDGFLCITSTTFYFKDVTVKRLTFFGVAEKKATQLTENHELRTIHDHIDYLIYRLETESKLRGAGYLIKSIETPYDVPSGFFDWVQQFKEDTPIAGGLAELINMDKPNGNHTRDEIRDIVTKQFKG
jgi:hypothetical protein